MRGISLTSMIAITCASLRESTPCTHYSDISVFAGKVGATQEFCCCIWQSIPAIRDKLGLAA